MSQLKIVAHYLFEIALSALIYVAFFYFNQSITAHIEDIQGVNWIFLPAGVRIFLTLIFNYSGAIGLSFACLLINYTGFYELDITTSIGVAMICGVAPLLGRHFVINNLQVEPDLSNLTLKQLLWAILAYSALSSGMHQLWFYVRGLDSGSWNHFIAMFFGDVVGSIFFVALIKYGIDVVKGRLGRNNLIE